MESPYSEQLDVITEEGFGRFTKQEIDLYRKYLSVPLNLTLIKKALFQMEFSDEELKTLKEILKDASFLSAISNLLQPSGEDITLIGGTRWSDRRFADLLNTEVKPLVLARQDSIKFIDEGIKRLKDIANGGSGEAKESIIDIGMLKDYADLPDQEVKRRAVAFQDTMTYLETIFSAIFGIINKKDETPDERQERLSKNSTK